VLQELRARGIPRLLLVAPDAEPPTHDDCEQDWVRLPADDADIRIRSATLAARAIRHRRHPEMSGDGRIHFRDRWVALSGIEEQLATLLVEHFREVVDRGRLEVAAWGRSRPSANAVRVHLCRLRKRLRPLGLAIRTVHNRGWLMEPASVADAAAP
jgi:DNA-binding response OmpR family regulator